jgi:hypothetical protein
MKHELQPTADETKARLIAQLAGYDRQPFIEQLAEIMFNGPRAEDWRKFARKAPDRWAASLATMAKLAGFTEKTENVHLHSHLHAIMHMSDVDLHARLRELTHALEAPSSDSASSAIVDAQCKDDTVSVQSESSVQGASAQYKDQNKSRQRTGGRRVRS